MPIDWKERRAAYDRTSIDWTRLRTYAAKVAAELTAASPEPRDGWHLDSRMWTRTTRGMGVEETAQSRYYYELRADGRLVNRIDGWTELLGRNVGWTRLEESTREHEFTDDDVILFDFSRELYGHDDGHVRVSTTRERGKKLLVHAKGVGLSRALKKLHE